MTSTRTRLVQVVVLLLFAAIVLACWPWMFAPNDRLEAPPSVPETPATSANTSLPATTATPTTTPVVSEPAPAPAERTAADPTAASGTGSLLVHVLWGDDKQPAAGIEVSVYRGGVDALFDEPHGHTDPQGTFLFKDLAPGKVYAQIERSDLGGGERVTLVAGQRTEVTLLVKPGMNCTGRVVDDRATAVGDADIVVSGWGGGKTQTVGRSAADGSFALRAMPTHCHIGARKAGFTPSPLRQFTASEGALVDFTIVLNGPGASLEGFVIDPQGHPVPDAVVRAGDLEQNNRTLPDGASAMGPQCEHVRTDAAGHFLFASVVPGKVPVSARARGLAPWQHAGIEVQAGRREQLTIRLQPGATVFGTVRNEAGAALAKVEVEAGDWPDLGRRSVRTKEDGTFQLDGLATGTIRLNASHDELGKTAITLVLATGEQRRWDAVLSTGLQLRGKVVDQDGKPVSQVMVEGQLEQPQKDDRWWGMENTNAEGRFVLKNCLPGRTLRLSFRRKSMFSELDLPGVAPGPEELIVKLPKEAWVYIQGTVLGPDDHALPNVHVSPFKKNGNGSPAETADGNTGAFRYGPYPPGKYSLHLSADGFPTIRIPERQLAPDEVWDLGTLHFQLGGTLAVAITTTTAPVPDLNFTIYDSNGNFAERLDTTAGAGRSAPLPPGNYVLQHNGNALVCRPQPFEIRADRETKIDVVLQPGTAIAIVCLVPEDAGADPMIQVVIREASGAVVWQGTVWNGNPRREAQPALAPGDYTVEATCGELRAQSPLTVGATVAGPLNLTLRRP